VPRPYISLDYVRLAVNELATDAIGTELISVSSNHKNSKSVSITSSFAIVHGSTVCVKLFVFFELYTRSTAVCGRVRRLVGPRK
jgi:hypothetical protein